MVRTNQSVPGNELKNKLVRRTGKSIGKVLKPSANNRPNQNNAIVNQVKKMLFKMLKRG